MIASASCCRLWYLDANSAVQVVCIGCNLLTAGGVYCELIANFGRLKYFWLAGVVVIAVRNPLVGFLVDFKTKLCSVAYRCQDLKRVGKLER